MNSAINNILQQYVETFMDTIADKFEINREELDVLWKETQKKKLKKNKKRRKRSSTPSAYILFCKDERAKIHDMNFKEIAKELGMRWQQATPEIKLHYQTQRDLLVQQKTQEPSTSNSISTDDEASVVSESIVVEEEDKKPKKPKKPKASDPPDNITNQRERDLWPEFAQLSIAELRTQCDHNNIKKSKHRNDMIHSLVVHRIALEDGDMQFDTDDES